MKQTIIFLLAIILTVSPVTAQSIVFTIDTAHTAQTVENIGASGAWFSEGIGKYWPDSIKNKMARLLFSKAFDKEGKPEGIGLSAFRFNIGGGTAEQGDSSGIANPVKRVESFLLPDGTYNWAKQSGYLWFVKKAKEYGVENLIAFSNTPPVQFTKNGLGFKTEKDYTTNLRNDKVADYAAFLATVVEHFNKEGIHFNYISPVNEPQWDWSNTFGNMNQEGSPWHNNDIYKVTVALDSALTSKHLSSQIIVAEAGVLTALYSGNGGATRQIQQFFSRQSPLFIGSLPHIKKVLEGHSYFTDNGDSNRIAVRRALRDTAAAYGVPFWQSEYSMLGDGYKEGRKGKIPAIDCALFLAKMIHTDLTVANATAWHLWNAWEPGSADSDTRYYLLALQNNEGNTEGNFTITKNLWAMGHYSRFIRPGMKRLVVERNDGLDDVEGSQNVMISAFANKRQAVMVVINYTRDNKTITLQGLPQCKTLTMYTTSGEKGMDMKPETLSSLKKIRLRPRSIVTIVASY